MARRNVDSHWTAKTARERFDRVFQRRQRRTTFRRMLVVCLLVMCVLGLPLGYFYQQSKAAARRTLLREVMVQRTRAESLAHDQNPAIKRLLSETQQARRQAETVSTSEALTLLETALRNLAEAQTLDARIGELERMHKPLGAALGIDVGDETGTTWQVSSWAIAKELKSLQQQYAAISEQLDTGEIDRAATSLAELLRGVAQLQKNNTLAKAADLHRQRWQRLREKIPDRLANHTTLSLILRSSGNAEEGWDAGEWNQSQRLYATAIEELDTFLKAEATPEERQAIFQADAATIANLEAETKSQREQIQQLTREKQTVETNLAKISLKRTEAEEQVEQLTAEQKKRLTELGTLRPLPKQLAEAQVTLKTTEEQLQAARSRENELAQTEKRLRGELDTVKEELAGAGKLLGKAGADLATITGERDALRKQLADGGGRLPIEFTFGNGKVPNIAGIEFAEIEGGANQMGSDKSGRDEEIPVHEVRISPFYLGTTEVTNKQILVWLNDIGDDFDDEWLTLGIESSSIQRRGNQFGLYTQSKFGKSEQQPVVGISWHGAKAFCDWASENDPNFNYRLPTEAEWEYACRAGSTTAYCFGDNDGQLEDYAWFGESYSSGSTHPVSLKKPNKWGLYDMHGNVSEWCSDWYGASYYSFSPKDNPTGPSEASRRVNRGGCWNSSVEYCRSADRAWSTPTSRNGILGFRVAAVPSSR